MYSDTIEFPPEMMAPYRPSPAGRPPSPLPHHDCRAAAFFVYDETMCPSLSLSLSFSPVPIPDYPSDETEKEEEEEEEEEEPEPDSISDLRP